MKEAEALPKVYDNTTNFENYTFINTRGRDEFGKELQRQKAINDSKLEKASQDPNYTKERKPIDESPICIKSDDSGVNEPGPGCYAKFDETLNIKSKEASVFFPADVFDKGKV